jgi:hypothetical protein
MSEPRSHASRIRCGTEGKFSRTLTPFETDHAKSQTPQRLGTGRVTRLPHWVRIDIAVDLNDESCFGAEEVDDEVADLMLSADLVSKLTVSDGTPQGGFGGRDSAAQTSSALQD